MNKNYDDEATQFEETTLMNEETDHAAEQENNQNPENAQKESNWKQAVIGASGGLLIGSVSTVLMGMTTPETEVKPEPENPGNHKEELSHPEWVDDEVQVATSVNDDMSFGEAFAAARAEVGPGGVFEWHGQLYGTYTAEEWNSMTAEERAEYGDHFSWNHIDHSASDVAQHSTTANHTTSAETQTATADDDIEVVSVDHEGPAGQSAGEEVLPVGYEETASAETEVEILGVVHDDETGMNIGAMNVSGEEVILVDVDNDLTFDYMAVDTNNNHSFEESELIDIQNEQLTVNDLGGLTGSPTGDMLASCDGPDYLTDAPYEA